MIERGMLEGAATARFAALRTKMDRRGVGVFACVDPANQTYLSGCRACTSVLATNRPAVGLDWTGLVVPALEELHARSVACVDEVWGYYEHPGASGPLSAEEQLDALLPRANGSAKIGLELSACPAALARRLAGRWRGGGTAEAQSRGCGR